MARGGKRSGAGRKAGSISEKTKARKELASRVALEGITPLEIMTTTMRDLWTEANAGKQPNIGKRMQAVMLAEKVAPYMHPKLTAVDVGKKGPGDVAEAMRELADKLPD